ncbi:MAG: S49 family peptidase [SAR202 cluster bacterium]|nr:S49 family peptidase [SAR202 cluster bacterium]
MASPGAMVGSIGVISVRPVMEGLLDKLGVEVSVNKSGAWKDMGAVWRQSTPEESQRLQAFVDEAFDSFVLAVAKARKMDVEKARAVATGEVYWAPKAKSVGLVDELGDLDRAIEVAAELAKVPKGRTTRLALKKSWREKMFSPLAESFAESVSSEIERRVWMNSLRY